MFDSQGCLRKRHSPYVPLRVCSIHSVCASCPPLTVPLGGHIVAVPVDGLSTLRWRHRFASRALGLLAGALVPQVSLGSVGIALVAVDAAPAAVLVVRTAHCAVAAPLAFAVPDSP